MSFNIIEASKKIASKYKRYLKTMFDIKDQDYKKIFEKRLEESVSFEKGPYLDVTNSFEKGKSIKELIDEGKISADFQYLDRIYKIPNLYKHQEEALLKAINGENLIVTTGTGSGKTECFLLPLINELMREKEQGTLSDGVRALIIYPMNALANDQIDRLRKTFINYPDITFGCYTGQTKHFDKTINGKKGAIDQYIDLNGKRVDDIRLRKPLPNERLSRESMKLNPPHILITNYAMLEYLLLRPEDNVFFDDSQANNWKFIILDEAHTYSGSTGIEVSMLLRRLKAKLSNKNLQFILTSATLGDEKSDVDVVRFAERLCSTPFKTENIIRASRIKLEQEENKYLLDTAFYQFVDKLISDGYEDKYVINAIEEKYSFGLKNYDDLGPYLYDLLICDNLFWKIKNYLSKPKSIAEIKEYTRLSNDEISSFVEVASRAVKNESKLFDSRYHMFLRATEGVFITLSPHKDLFLNRKNEVVDENGETFKVFEAVTCSQCHSLYLLGFIKNGYLIQKSCADSDEIKEAFYIGNSISDSDEDSSLENTETEVANYELCPHCGFIRSSNEVHKSFCGHDESHFVKVVKVKTTNNSDGRVTKCISCENVNRLGILKGFFSGLEASTSVIGTALFEELPSHIKKITVHNEDENDGFDVGIDESVEEIAKAKQFIAFSDSRQAAAYFSSYFSVSYDSLLYGRLIKECLNASQDGEIEMPAFIDDLVSKFKEHEIIPLDVYLNKIKKNSLKSYEYVKVAWQALLKEFVNCNSRNSLIGLGLLGVDFNRNLLFGPHNSYNLNKEEVKDICMNFVLGMLADPAMYYPANLNENDKEFFTYNGIEFSYLKEDKDKYVRSFIPKSRSNKRFDYLKRILTKLDPNTTDDKVKTVLSQIWDNFFAPNKPGRPQILIKDSKSHYKVNLENLILDNNKKWYRCEKCNKITAFNVKGVCPTYQCDGKLVEVKIDDLEKDNHYYRMYHDLITEPLRVVEHTAQLNREEAYTYQSLFKDQKIDVLSCSTTFEMGVDVGDLETVFMRNMPPSASNYAQRAGRAGRSITAAAFALTFCNKSNHDFNYFEKPIDMINGTILPPQFKEDNEKICIRHLYSSAFSYFFKVYPEYFNTAVDIMDKCKKTGLSGFDVLKNFLTTPSQYLDDLKVYLKESIPESLHERFKLDDFGWVDWFFDQNYNEYPSLAKVRSVYLSELNTLRSAYDTAKLNGDPEQYRLKNRIETYETDPVINFLSRNNILPKYGFPVDSVELESNPATKETDFKGLQLSRDLSMAISEYAPGCQVVADDKLITSRYIKKAAGLDWHKYDYITCEHCKTLNVEIHTGKNTIEVCKQCHRQLNPKMVKTFLIPEFGFVADENIRKPSLIKPEKTYRTEASFFTNGPAQNKETYRIGDTDVEIAMVGNDGEMAMLNTTDFFVCPVCGYATTGESNEAINPYINHIPNKKGHNDPKGYPCNSKVDLERYSLGYKFKTDVIRIRFNKPLLSKTDVYDEAYSILQALLLAACKELNIEQSEIAGCLQYYFDNGDNYSYILYDNTPGGAGHVKRLNNQNTILHVLINAMNIAQKCPNCDEDSSCYSCLRTYYNQKHHDIIKRKYVSDYLGQILIGYKDDESDSKLEDLFLDRLKHFADSWQVSGDGKNIYHAVFNNQKWDIEPQVTLNSENGVKVQCKPDFVLTPKNSNQKKIAIFTDGFKYHNDILDEDSLKRNAIIGSGNYRVWCLSWHDVKDNNRRKIYSTDIFNEDNLSSKLINSKHIVTPKNNLELLIEYLKDNDSEKNFKDTAVAYFNAMSGKKPDVKEIINVFELMHISLTSKEINNMCKYVFDSDSPISIYLLNSDERYVFTYIQDYVEMRNENFVYDWNAYLQITNIMQFVDNFRTITKKGLDMYKYVS